MANFISKLIAGEVGNALPTSLMGVRIDPKILSFRENVLNDPGERRDLEAGLKEKEQAQQESIGQLGPEDFYPTFQQNISTIEGIKSRAAGLKAIRLDRFVVNLEDADTFVLKRRGILNSIKSMFGYGDVQVRLAGIDAPEVASHSGDPLAAVRIFQNQPYGEEAAAKLKEIVANQDKLSLLVSTGNQTYGRYLGVATGDNGLNINLEEVRQGIASALPFGPRSEDIVNRTIFGQAEDQAYQNRQGMWGYARYRAARQANQEIGSPITWNTLTRLDKTAGNLNLGAYSSFLEGFGDQQRDLTAEEVSTARRIGRTLSKNYGPRANQALNKIPGKDDSYNRIEGLKHGGVAQEMRRSMTDFGSGLIRAMFGSMKIFERSAVSDVKSTFASFLKSSETKILRSTEALRYRTTHVSKAGKIGDTLIKEGIYIGKEMGNNPRFTYQSIFHEMAEKYWGQKGVQYFEKRGMFGSHLSPAVVAEEALFGAKLGPKYFREMKKMRGYEKELTLEKIKKLKLTGNITQNQEAARLEHYINKTQDIYNAVEKKHLPRFNKAANPKKGFLRGWFSDQKELNTDFTNKGCWLRNVVSKAWRSIRKSNLKSFKASSSEAVTGVMSKSDIALRDSVLSRARNNFAIYEDVANALPGDAHGARFGARNIAKLSEDEYWNEVVPELKAKVKSYYRNDLEEKIAKLPELYSESGGVTSEIRRGSLSRIQEAQRLAHSQSKSNLVSSMKKSPGRNHVSNSAASPKGPDTVSLKIG